MIGSVIDKRLVQANDISYNWSKYNPVLLSGEIGFEVDTGKFKIGNGFSAWEDLKYQGSNLVVSEYNTVYLDGMNTVLDDNVRDAVLIGNNIKTVNSSSGSVVIGNNAKSVITSGVVIGDSAEVSSYYMNNNVFTEIPYGSGVANSVAIGRNTKGYSMNGSAGFVIGQDSKTYGGVTIGTYSESKWQSIAMGSSVNADDGGIAMGYYAKSNVNSIAIGYYSESYGNMDMNTYTLCTSVAVGFNAKCLGQNSVVIGPQSNVGGSNENPHPQGSVSVGNSVKITSNDTFCFGSQITCKGESCLFIGKGLSTYSYSNVISIGYGLGISSNDQTIIGRYSEADTNNKYAYIFGAGTDMNNRKNLHTIDREGTAYFDGKVTVNASAEIVNDNDLITKQYHDNTVKDFVTKEQANKIITDNFDNTQAASAAFLRYSNAVNDNETFVYITTEFEDVYNETYNINIELKAVSTAEDDVIVWNVSDENNYAYIDEDGFLVCYESAVITITATSSVDESVFDTKTITVNINNESV